MKKNLYLLLLLIVGTAFFGCKTQKSRDDISPLKKFYHNTTSEFNGYYNADLLMTESITQLNDQQQDNYNQTLEIYEYMGAPNHQAVVPNLDKAMEKVAIVISLHRPSHWTDDCYLLMGQAQFLKKDYESAEETFKYLLDEFPEEPSAASKKRKGKKKKASKKEKKKEAEVKKKERDKTRAEKKKEAKRRKKEREKERKRKIKESKRKKKGKKGKKKSSSKKKEITDEKTEEVKKEEEAPKEEKKEVAKKDKNPNSPDKYFMKHRPAYREAQLWYGRVLIERSKFDAADRIFRQIEADPKTFKDIRRELAPAMAYSAFQQKNYPQTIAYLRTAIELGNDKYLKARYAYIIAQLEQKNKNNSEAYAYFEKALKFRPGYEMEFNAKLQIAQNAWATGQSSPEEIIKRLNKMLADGKNNDFRDQIYFTLAQVALQQNDKKEAIKNLQLSASNNTGNLNQKAEAYYQLATLFLDDESYVDAKLYFDSTLTVMPDIDDRYKEVVKYALNLADIATNILAVEYQDSLLTIMKMTDEEKKALALKIRQAEEKQRIEDAKAAAKGNATATSAPTRRATTGKNLARPGAAVPGAGKVAGQGPIPQFFAYDDRSKKRGGRSFQRKWGSTRPDVDNWRISSKIEEVEIDDADEEKDDFVTTTDLTPEQVDEILSEVPSNPVERNAANKIIEDALYQLGKLYRDNLENNEKSIESLEELLKRYPETDYKIESWYYLYLAHTALGNSAEAKVYYDKILREAPESLYATVLKNPNYYNELESEDSKLGKYYDQAYTKFTNGNYKGAFVQAQGAAEKFGPKNKLSAKFALLSAMSTGSLEGKDQYIKSLKDVVAQYPDTEEQKRAREMLRLLGDESSFSTINDGSDNEATVGKKGKFKVDDKDLHYVIVALEGDADLGKAKSDVGQYHRKFFKNESMRVSNIYLGKDQKDRVPIIVIRRFKGKEKAMAYYDGVKKNAKDFLGINFKYQIYPITQNNYRQILKERSLSDYPKFFEENYK